MDVHPATYAEPLIERQTYMDRVSTSTPMGKDIQSRRAINRALLDVALKWGVDPERAHHNPVFWHDGALHYYDPVSHREEVFAYLKERGILSDGFNGAFKLNYHLDELDKAADADFEQAIDLEVVVSLLVAQLFYGHGELRCHDQQSDDRRVHHCEKLTDLVEHLRNLGFVERVEAENSAQIYRWTEVAVPILRARYML